MAEPNIPLKASAVLIWLPEGQTPDEEGFDLSQVEPPPDPNPEPWWEARQAIVYAREVQRNHRKLPWIKVDNILLTPDEILEAYQALRGSR